MPENEPITTEAEALADILAWSEGRPIWQRDALRRLIVAESLTDGDINELTALCKDHARPSDPLSADHIRAPEAGLPPVQMRTIRDMQNVNALAERQRINFLQAGITVVYGDNGSGKSGYVRILKCACRARGSDAPILKNIYTDPAGPQLAELDFIAGGQEQNTQWRAGEAISPLLSGISVFDSRTANVHVDETNDVAYTPFPMKLLERLVQACRAVKAKINAEIETLSAQTPQVLNEPACSDDTEVGKFIAGLSKNTPIARANELAALSEEEEAQLATLAADLAQDPRATATRLQGYKRRLDALHTKLNNLAEAASDVSAERLQGLLQDYEAKKQAARLAAQAQFGDDPLPGVGSEVWRALWETARAYSVESPYPEKAFPVTVDDARCVLCQQELDPEAAERLRRFEIFVRDRTQQAEITAKQALMDFESELLQHALSISALHEAVLFLCDDLGQPELADRVRGFGLHAKWRLRRFLRLREATDMPVANAPEAELRALGNQLATRAAALLAEEESEERKALKQELKELRDRQWFAGITDDVIAEIGRKKEIAARQTAIRDTRQNEITNKSSALAETLVTDRLRGCFAQEIDHLDLAGLAIELRRARSQPTGLLPGTTDHQ